MFEENKLEQLLISVWELDSTLRDPFILGFLYISPPFKQFEHFLPSSLFWKDATSWIYVAVKFKHQLTVCSGKKQLTKQYIMQQ